MTSERIKELHLQTAYPKSRSVHQALLQVWNECAQESYSEEECYRTLHNLMTDIKLQGTTINDDIDLKEWFEQFKK